MSMPTEFRGAGSNLGATIRQGLRMMSGQDVPNYTIVFLDPAKNFQRGESKNFVVPYMVMGRGAACNVQFGDEYSTVSRQHCSIQVDGSEYTLIHNPQATNPTLVDGKPVVGSYKLKTGDEIQLSYEGPKVRFLVDSTQRTSTMGFTRRMSVAMAQSLRPYRRGLAILGLLLLATVGYSIWSTMRISSLGEQHAQLVEEMKMSDERIQAQEAELAALEASGRASAQQVAGVRNQLNQERQRRADIQTRVASTEVRMKEADVEIPVRKEIVSNQSTSGDNESGREEGMSSNNSSKEIPDAMVSDELEIFESAIYYITVEKFTLVRPNGKPYNLDDEPWLKWGGTGFLADGKFITARHVIEPWKFIPPCDPLIIMNDFIQRGFKVNIQFKATAAGGKGSFLFSNTELRNFDTSSDRDSIYICPNFPNHKDKIKSKLCLDWSTDWAYTPMANRPSEIKYNRELSQNLEKGEPLYALAYTMGLHLQNPNWASNLDPLFKKASVAQSRITNSRLTASGSDFGPGDSGAPVFVKRGNEYFVVGLISGKLGSQGIIIPSTNIR